MQAPMFVAPSAFVLPEPPAGTVEVADLMRQLIEVQKEQLALQRAQQANNDAASKWRMFLTRWDAEFPGLAADCKRVLPTLERAYLALIRELIDRTGGEDADDLDSEFALGEFLDRYGVRLGQLGSILGQIGPLAEAAPA